MMNADKQRMKAKAILRWSDIRLRSTASIRVLLSPF